MKLTCVTATFNCIKAGNRERLIRCIESVAKLKTEHEHLIYDGVSTDGTAELLRELEAKTPGLKVVSEPDTGIYNALNKGVRAAQGEWFYVLGADDYIFSFETMDNLLATVEDKFDILVSPVIKNGAIFGLNNRKVPTTLFLHAPYCHQGVIIKTNICRHFGGFDERYRICADYDMMFKAHASALHFLYSTAPFADFAESGMSSQCVVETRNETNLCRAVHMHLSKSEQLLYDKRGAPPLRSIVPWLLHKDSAIRCSARHLIVCWVKCYIRLVLSALGCVKSYPGAKDKV